MMVASKVLLCSFLCYLMDVVLHVRIQEDDTDKDAVACLRCPRTTGDMCKG
jgi:hypothetical protein